MTRHALLVATLLVTLAGAARAQDVDTFHGVVLPDGADPWMIRHDGWYYLTVTTGSDVTLWRSRTITGIGGGERRVVFTPPPGTPFSDDLWAPELHRLDGAWYIYVAADDGDNANHRMWVLENLDADPFSASWRLKGKLADATDRWAIDGTVAAIGSERYFVWSGWAGADDGQQDLYIARMSDPWTLSSARVRLASPTRPWEANTQPRVLEGPQVYVRGGMINIIYSASGSWTDGYCLGLLSAPVGADLLDPASWRKAPSPLFASANGVMGPGHASIVASPDGSEDWLIHHAARWPGAGWTRNVRAQRIAWTPDGLPVLGAPAAPDAPQRVPAGEPRRWRVEAESGVLAGGARIIDESSASGGRKVGYLDRTTSWVEVRVSVPRSGRYLLVPRVDNGTAAEETAVYRLSVNGLFVRDLHVPFGEWNRWTATPTPAYLRAGVNRLRLTKRRHHAELDCIDVVPLR